MDSSQLIRGALPCFQGICEHSTPDSINYLRVNQCLIYYLILETRILSTKSTHKQNNNLLIIGVLYKICNYCFLEIKIRFKILIPIWNDQINKVSLCSVFTTQAPILFFILSTGPTLMSIVNLSNRKDGKYENYHHFK